jgi:hypothetical protein
MFILLNNVTTDAQKCSPFCSKHKRALRLTPLITFCNINLYTHKCIDSRRPTASVPALTLITNLMDRSIHTYT